MPRRRCVGCGRIAPKAELIRIAVERDGDPSRPLAVRDAGATMPGRGAYLCGEGRAELPAGECLERAVRRGGIARGLRAAVSLDPKLVELMSR